MRGCSVPGCTRRHEAHGWCPTHLRRWQKHGDVSKGRRLVSEKLCRMCGVVKPRAEFFPLRQRYVTGRCRECTRRVDRERGRTPQRRAKARAHHHRHRAVILEQMRARYCGTAEIRREYMRQWRRKYPERAKLIRVANDRRRTAAPGQATMAQIAARVAYFGWACWMCGAPWTCIDHVKPLAKGGANWPANLRPACFDCNAKKAARWDGVAVLAKRSA